MKFLGWYHDEELTLKVDSITVQDQPITYMLNMHMLIHILH